MGALEEVGDGDGSAVQGGGWGGEVRAHNRKSLNDGWVGSGDRIR